MPTICSMWASFGGGRFRWSKQTRRKLGISIKYIGFEEIVYDWSYAKWGKKGEINTSNSVFILMFFLNRRFKGVSLILSTWFHEAIIIFFLTLNRILCFWPSMYDLIILFYNFSIRIIIDNIIIFQKIIIIQF